MYLGKNYMIKTVRGRKLDIYLINCRQSPLSYSLQVLLNGF